MPVAHQPPAAIIGELVGMAAEQARNLSLDGLRQKRSRAVAQNLGQRIGKSSWLRELENIGLGHGVSLLCWRSGGVEHLHDTPPYPFTPSPTFAHSSSDVRGLVPTIPLRSHSPLALRNIAAAYGLSVSPIEEGRGRNEAFTYRMRGAGVRCYDGVGERADFAHARPEHHELSHHHTAAGAGNARAHREPIRRVRRRPWRRPAAAAEQRLR